MNNPTMLSRVTNVIGTTFLNGGSYEDIAKAVLHAMRDPTDEMIRAGYDAPMRTDTNLGEWKHQQCRVDYEAMIDAAFGNHAGPALPEG
jgi:hypothetical protein